MTFSRRSVFAAIAAVTSLSGAMALPAHARPSAGQLVAEGRSALDRLYASEPRARFLAKQARAVLVFPSILKGGLIWGGESGDGVLFVDGRPEGFYNISAGSFGLQAGGQQFSSALFFMNNRALDYVHRSAGWAIGSAPNVVVVNTGETLVANTTTLSQDVYVIPFGQKGLMAGIDIHASKITYIHPD